MVVMRGMPYPSPRGCEPHGQFGRAALAKAHPAFAPPPCVEPPSPAAPSPKPRNPFAETWPPRALMMSNGSSNPFASLRKVRGVAKQWREKVRGSPPKGTPKGTPSPTGAGFEEGGEPAEPRLQLAVKPFGKDGVRLGWQCGWPLDGESLHLEWQAAAGGEWCEHAQVEAGGKPLVVKSVAGHAAGPPAKRAWRVCSSAGDDSAPARLGDSRKHGSALFRTAAASPAAPRAAGAGSSGGGSSSSQAELPTSEAGLLELLRSRQGEVDCLLRVDLSSDAGISNARRAVQDALSLDDELDALAAKGALKGKIFQGLLEALRAAGAGHSQLDNSCKNLTGMALPQEYGLSLMQWSMLTLQADALRNLVRIKVADDNDLRTARLGLLLCNDFFQALARLAELRGSASEHAALLSLGHLAC